MSSSIACSGYLNQQFKFIVKSNNNYTYRSVGTTDEGYLLSDINGYPNATFEGLCAYASETESMYLSFKSKPKDFFRALFFLLILIIGTITTPSPDNEKTSYNTTISTIYQLQSNQFSKTPIELRNTTLFSFVHVKDSNNTSNLAYITFDNNQHTLNLKNFQTLNLTSKPISGPGILAVGGNNSQNLFLIQASSIDEYRLGNMDFTQTALQTQLDIKSGTIGEVLSYNDTDYISVYYPEREELNLFVHALGSKYEHIVMSNNYFDLSGNNATQPNSNTVPQLGTTSGALSKPSTSFNPSDSIKPTSTTRDDFSDRASSTIKSSETIEGKINI